MTSMVSWSTRTAGAVGVLVLLASAACTGPGDTPPDDTPVASPLPAATDLPSDVTAPECEDADGRTVTQLPDVVVPEVRVEPVTTPATQVDGETVPGSVVEGFLVPAVLVDAGCVISYDAPGGCLGAVEITAATIPALFLPESTIPDVTLPDGQEAGAVTLPAVEVPAVTAPAVRTEQVCQIEVDGELPTVSRAGAVREALSRTGTARPGDSRPEVCGDEGCVAALRVDAVQVEAARLPDVDVDPGRLRSQELTPDIAVISGEDAPKTSFVAPADLLFDTDQYVIRGPADSALRAIASQLQTYDRSVPVLVEGHTDDVGEETYNLELSQRRAQEVAVWLVTNAGLDPDVVTVTGLGETTPAYPNDSDPHRQGNRRVVVTVG